MHKNQNKFASNETFEFLYIYLILIVVDLIIPAMCTI